MDTIFMNSEKSKNFESHVLILKLTDKLDLRRGERSIALLNLSIYYTWKNIKSFCLLLFFTIVLRPNKQFFHLKFLSGISGQLSKS